MKWIELKEGCEMPEIGKPTIWRQEDGSYLSRSIKEGDIEDNFCWWKGWVVGFQNCTHWAYVIGPGEEPSTESNQEEESDQDKLVEAISRAYHYGQMNYPITDVFTEFLEGKAPNQEELWDHIWESLDFYPGDVSLQHIMKNYTLSRK